MALPGLGLAAPTTESASSAAPVFQNLSASSTVHTLAAESEWRFEVTSGSTIEVKILSGTAEIFGTELATNKIYSFKNTKAAVYTWHGCRIEVTGPCEEYTAEETPMWQYVNTHFALENERKTAAASGNVGPVVLVVGPNNSGKTSLVKLLTAYTTKMGGQPLVVNTDNREGMLSVPGALTATVFSSYMDVEEGLGSSPTSGPSPVPVKQPLCYYYGLASPEDNSKLYKAVITRLALSATGRLADDPEVKRSGMIIDTPGIISQGKNGYDLLSHIISEFSVSVIFTLGSERLQADMSRRFAARSNQSPLTVLKLNKSGGCVDRDDPYMSLLRQTQIREYFFGMYKQPLSPTTLSVEFSTLTIYKIREASAIQASFLPGSDEADEGPTELSVFEKREPSSLMLHALLAVMYAGTGDDQNSIRDASVMGFVYVAEVDEKRKRLKILSPTSGGVGNRPLIWGSWPEGVGSLIG